MLLPRSCPVCDAPGPAPCLSCWQLLRPASAGPCPDEIDWCVSLLSYEGAGRELLARLKYRNSRSSLPWLAAAMATLVDRDAVDAVTWAPTTPARRRERGFDQAAALASGVARRLRLPCLAQLVRAPGPAQTGLPAASRHGGPQFSPRRRARPPARLLLVDDVVTSGATLTAAARALRRAGVAEVGALTAGRTPLRAATPVRPRPQPPSGAGVHCGDGPRAGLWLQVDASRRRNDPRKATLGC